MSRPSSRRLDLLPAPETLERLCRSLAMLDAILSPEWDYRYYSFNRHWDAGRGQRMASMRNGSGDELFILFLAGGAILKGFAHESRMASAGAPLAGMFEGVPVAYQEFLSEPAFSIENCTFCLWYAGDGWHRGSVPIPGGPDPDGSEELLAILGGAPSDYVRFAEGYYEVEVPGEAVARLYRHEPLTPELVEALNPGVKIEALQGDIEEIGYPIGDLAAPGAPRG